MRLKKYLLRMIVLVLACCLCFAVVFACACLYQLTDEETPPQNSVSGESAAINHEAAPTESTTQDDTLPESVVTNNIKDADTPIDFSGEYGFTADGPQAFRTFRSVVLTMTNYDAPYGSSHYGEKIAPRGHVKADNREYQFRSIAVGPTDIAFETETRHGISYRFTGKLNSKCSCDFGDGTYIEDITGRLVKIEAGKIAAVATTGLVSYGC